MVTTTTQPKNDSNQFIFWVNYTDGKRAFQLSNSAVYWTASENQEPIWAPAKTHPGNIFGSDQMTKL